MMENDQKGKNHSRYFSEDFKKEKVKYIEEGLTTIGELCKEYKVSRVSVYRWLYKYSSTYQKGERVVVEKESEEAKRKKMIGKIAELERTLGQKQMEVEYLKKIIDFGSDCTGIDIKKKFDSKF
jgi:transposase